MPQRVGPERALATVWLLLDAMSQESREKASRTHVTPAYHMPYEMPEPYVPTTLQANTTPKDAPRRSNPKVGKVSTQRQNTYMLGLGLGINVEGSPSGAPPAPGLESPFRGGAGAPAAPGPEAAPPTGLPSLATMDRIVIDDVLEQYSPPKDSEEFDESMEGGVADVAEPPRHKRNSSLLSAPRRHDVIYEEAEEEEEAPTRTPSAESDSPSDKAAPSAAPALAVPSSVTHTAPAVDGAALESDLSVGDGNSDRTALRKSRSILAAERVENLVDELLQGDMLANTIPSSTSAYTSELLGRDPSTVKRDVNAERPRVVADRKVSPPTTAPPLPTLPSWNPINLDDMMADTLGMPELAPPASKGAKEGEAAPATARDAAPAAAPAPAAASASAPEPAPAAKPPSPTEQPRRTKRPHISKDSIRKRVEQRKRAERDLPPIPPGRAAASRNGESLEQSPLERAGSGKAEKSPLQSQNRAETHSPESGEPTPKSAAPELPGSPPVPPASSAPKSPEAAAPEAPAATQPSAAPAVPQAAKASAALAAPAASAEAKAAAASPEQPAAQPAAAPKTRAPKGAAPAIKGASTSSPARPGPRAVDAAVNASPSKVAPAPTSSSPSRPVSSRPAPPPMTTPAEREAQIVQRKRSKRGQETGRSASGSDSAPSSRKASAASAASPSADRSASASGEAAAKVASPAAAQASPAPAGAAPESRMAEPETPAAQPEAAAPKADAGPPQPPTAFSNLLERELTRICRENDQKYRVRDRGVFHTGPKQAEHPIADRSAAWQRLRGPNDVNAYARELEALHVAPTEQLTTGRVFVIVDSFIPKGLPVPKEPTDFYCILDNGIHMVKTGLTPLNPEQNGTCPILQEFELVEHMALEFSLTLMLRIDEHLIEKGPPPEEADERGGTRMGRLFNTLAKGTGTARAAGLKPRSKAPTGNVPPLLMYANRLGTLGRATVRFEDVRDRCTAKTAVVDVPVSGVGESQNAKHSVRGLPKMSAERSRGFAAALNRPRGTLRLRLFYLPPLPNTLRHELPGNLEECEQGMDNVGWHQTSTSLKGVLTQMGGDCSTWRRRPVRVIGLNMICFNEVTRRPTIRIDLMQALSIEDCNDPACLADGAGEVDEPVGVPRSFRVTFRDGERITFFADTNEEKMQWMHVLHNIVTHRLAAPPRWALAASEAVRSHQEQQANVAVNSIEERVDMQDEQARQQQHKHARKAVPNGAKHAQRGQDRRPQRQQAGQAQQGHYGEQAQYSQQTQAQQGHYGQQPQHSQQAQQAQYGQHTQEAPQGHYGQQAQQAQQAYTDHAHYQAQGDQAQQPHAQTEAYGHQGQAGQETTSAAGQAQGNAAQWRRPPPPAPTGIPSPQPKLKETRAPFAKFHLQPPWAKSHRPTVMTASENVTEDGAMAGAGGAGNAGEQAPADAYAEHAQQQAWDTQSPAYAEWAQHTNAYQPEHAYQDAAHTTQGAYYQGGQHDAQYANGYWHDYGYQDGAQTQDAQQYQNWPADGQAAGWSAPAAEAAPAAPASQPASKGPLGKVSKNVFGRFGKAAKAARA